MQSPLNTDRGKLRMEKLKQLELEQLQWEQEALVMPEYLNRALFLSFESVKTEFSDLDGLSWSHNPANSPWVEEPTPKLTSTEIDTPEIDTRTTAHPPRHLSRPPSRSLVSPSRGDTAQDTIRASRLSRGPLQPTHQFLPNSDPHSHTPKNLALACHLSTLLSHQ